MLKTLTLFHSDDEMCSPIILSRLPVVNQVHQFLLLVIGTSLNYQMFFCIYYLVHSNQVILWNTLTIGAVAWLWVHISFNTKIALLWNISIPWKEKLNTKKKGPSIVNFSPTLQTIGICKSGQRVWWMKHTRHNTIFSFCRQRLPRCFTPAQTAYRGRVCMSLGNCQLCIWNNWYVSQIVTRIWRAGM